jgi:hypothetical protein
MSLGAMTVDEMTGCHQYWGGGSPYLDASFQFYPYFSPYVSIVQLYIDFRRLAKMPKTKTSKSILSKIRENNEKCYFKKCL